LRVGRSRRDEARDRQHTETPTDAQLRGRHFESFASADRSGAIAIFSAPFGGSNERRGLDLRRQIPVREARAELRPALFVLVGDRDAARQRVVLADPELHVFYARGIGGDAKACVAAQDARALRPTDIAE
jgi:hypothetical protein